MPELDQVEQSYYPSARVRLVIRFDEFDDTAAQKTTNAKIKKRPHRKRGTVDPDAPLDVVPDPEAPPGVVRFLLVPKGSTSSANSQQKTTADAREQVLGDIIPKRAHLGLNGIRQADTLDVDIRFADCPFDPRTIRAARVYFFLGTVTADQFARGIDGQKVGDTDPSAPPATAALPLNVIQDSRVDANGNTISNLRFQGWVDEWEIDRPEGEEPVLRLKCRDHTQLLADAIAPPNLVIDAKQPIDKAVATYLSNFSQMQGFKVEYRSVSGSTPPALGDALSSTAFRPDLGPVPSKGGGASASRTSVLDYLTDVCGAIGHNIRFEGGTIVIQQPRTLLGFGYARGDDPFQGRGTSPIRRFIYGRDILEMKITRKYARRSVNNIEVRSYDAENKTTIVVRFPEGKDDTQNQPQPGAGVDQKWTVIRVAGIKDKKTLKITAQSYYEQIGRNEIVIHLTTKNLASFGGGNLDPDILDMQAGDAFEVLDHRAEAGQDTGANINNLIEAASLTDRIKQFMGDLGFDPASDLVAQYAEAYKNKGVLVIFRMQSASLAWDVDDGVGVDITGANYMLRSEKKLSDGETEPGKTGGQG